MINDKDQIYFINSYIDKIKESIIPKYILNDGQEVSIYFDKVNELLEILRTDYINNYKEKSIDIFSDVFNATLDNDINSIIDYLDDKIKEPKNVKQLNSTVVKFKTILESSPFLLIEKDIRKELEEKVQLSDSKTFKGLIKNSLKKLEYYLFMTEPISYEEMKDRLKENIQKISFFFKEPKKENNELWETIALESLKKLKEDFNFSSIYIYDKLEWKEIYDWSNSTYQAIKEAQENIGLDISNTGVDKKLGIELDTKFLNDRLLWACFNTNVSEENSAIVLKQLEKSTQRKIWQHEYFHFLDKQVGLLFNKETNENNKNEYASSLIFKDNKNFENLNPKFKKSVIYLQELLSVLLYSTNSESNKEIDNQNEKKFFSKINEFVLKSLVDEKYLKYDSLTEEEKNSYLNNEKLKEFSLTLLSNVLKNEKDYNKIDKSKLFEILKESNLNINFNEFNKNMNEKMPDIRKNILKLINNNGFVYDFYENNYHFVKSDTALAAINQTVLTGKVYWSQTLEILARASESLQEKLIIGTKEYFEKNKENSSSQYLNPFLNKNERILLVKTIHSFADILGIKCNPNLKDLPCLEKELNSEELATFNEKKDYKLIEKSMLTKTIFESKLALKIAKLRNEKQEIKELQRLKK